VHGPPHVHVPVEAAASEDAQAGEEHLHDHAGRHEQQNPAHERGGAVTDSFCSGGHVRTIATPVPHASYRA